MASLGWVDGDGWVEYILRSLTASWRAQLFILEGIPVILWAVITWLYLPNYPENASFLTEDERAAIIADLPEQAPTMHAKTFDLEQVKAMLKSPTFVPFTMIWITHGVGGWGISFVLPTVIYELGISNTGIAQVMTMVRKFADTLIPCDWQE
jgi:hypothetical protein